MVYPYAYMQQRFDATAPQVSLFTHANNVYATSKNNRDVTLIKDI